MCACFSQSLDMVRKTSMGSDEEWRAAIAIAEMDASTKIEHFL
jgi:hypothetical protein